MSGIPTLRKSAAGTAGKKMGGTYCKTRQLGTKTSGTNQRGYTNQKNFHKEENARLTVEVAEQKENIQRLDKELSTAQAQLLQLQKSSEDNCTRLTNEVEDLKSSNMAYEDKLCTYEKKFLLHNLDPVTFDSLEPDDNQKVLALKKQETAKLKVISLKQKINSLNQESSFVLENLKVLGKQVDEIAVEEFTEET